ncbi:MAG: hypothetical protein K6V73_04810 [Firmicutes bacterium]|nr:hypothetical protein [Bacillota bacterium]
MRHRRRRYEVRWRRLFVLLVALALLATVVMRHRVERALGLAAAPVAVPSRRPPAPRPRAGGGAPAVAGGQRGKAGGGKAGGASTPSPGPSGGSGGSTPPAGGAGGAGGGQTGSGTAPPPPSVSTYPGAATVVEFYADLAEGRTAAAYALLAPSLTSQVTPDAFARTYAAVRGVHLVALGFEGAGNFTRLFRVTVAFTLAGGRVETTSGTVAVQDQSGGVGTPDWAISQLGPAP